VSAHQQFVSHGGEGKRRGEAQSQISSVTGIPSREGGA